MLIVPPKPNFGSSETPKTDITITRADLDAKFESFKKDDTNLKKVESHGLEWMLPGFVVELFVPDFSDKSFLAKSGKDLLGDALDIYKRYTGIGKVLSASPHNEGPRADIKPGDIVYLGDDLANMAKNHAYEEWLRASPNQIKDKVPPIEYIQKVHRWIDGGMLYLVNRGDVTANQRGLEVSLKTIGSIKEPMVFRLPPMDVLYRVKGNPFG